MMDNFTPLSRRLIALGLLVLVILAALSWIILPLVAANEAALGELSRVRRALTRVQAQVDGPEAPPIAAFPMQAAIQAKDRKAASEALGGRLAALAANTNVRIQLLPTAESLASAPSLVTVGLSATGSREDIMRFMNALEAGSPQIRFQRFHLARDAAQAAPPVQTATAAPGAVADPSPPAPSMLRLDGEAAALWSGGE